MRKPDIKHSKMKQLPEGRELIRDLSQQRVRREIRLDFSVMSLLVIENSCESRDRILDGIGLLGDQILVGRLIG